MKNRLLQALLALTLLLALCLCMTGCSKQNYRKAINYYNLGQYDSAASLFAQLDDYEDSARYLILSQYAAAIDLMEKGDYDKALPRFLKLGNYEDASERATECKYQMAIAAFESDDFEDAENYFLEQPQYRQAPEYLRRIVWQKLFDAVKKSGEKAEDGIILQKEQDGTVLRVTAADNNQLVFFVSNAKDMGYCFYDDLALTLNRDSLDAIFTANSSFVMEFVGDQIGSLQTASGRVDISACTIDTQLIIDHFQMTVTDNLGITSTSEDPADSLMRDTMADNLSLLLTQIPLLLEEHGITWSLTDIGFAPNT